MLYILVMDKDLWTLVWCIMPYLSLEILDLAIFGPIQQPQNNNQHDHRKKGETEVKNGVSKQYYKDKDAKLQLHSLPLLDYSEPKSSENVAKGYGNGVDEEVETDTLKNIKDKEMEKR